MAGGVKDLSDFLQRGVTKAWESYATLLGREARRGVNNPALKWDRPTRCVATTILGQTSKQGPAFQGETGAGLMSTEHVSGFPKLR